MKSIYVALLSTTMLFASALGQDATPDNSGAKMKAQALMPIAASRVPSLPAAADESLTLLPRWKQGEKHRFEVVKSRQKRNGEKTTLNSVGRTGLEIEVLSTAKDAVVLAWTFGGTKLDDPGQAGNPFIQKMTNLLKGYRIVLELDSQAAIQRVQNWKEVKETAAKVFETMTNELKVEGIDQATIEKTLAPIASMYATKEQIEQFCTREAQLFFIAMGIEFNGNNPVEYDAELPNPLGGEPFPSRARIVLKEADHKLGVAKVSWTQTVAPEDVCRIMEKTSNDMVERSGKSIPDSDALKTLNFEDTAEFNIDIPSGWIRNLTYKRLTKVKGISQEDVITVTRKN